MRSRLGIWGWVRAGRLNIERYLFTMHRITGVILVFYLFLHIIVTSTRAFGKERWESVKQFLGMHTTFTHILEYCLIVAVVYHGLNGLRLIFTELGFFIGRPKRPVYPYVASSLAAPRIFMIILMIIAAFILVVGFYDFFWQ
jgi:succinate dehydrogenase / fumarate reductase cytochrome b subunit